MTVRPAKFVDVPGIIRVYEDGFQRSIYADRATFDASEAKKIIAQAIHRHGHTTNGGTLVLVSENEGQVEGFIVGLLDSVYPGLKELMATDLLFIMSTKANPRDASTMLKQLASWAEANQRVIELHLGINDAIGDWNRTAKLYERLGLIQCGAMFRRSFKR